MANSHSETRAVPVHDLIRWSEALGGIARTALGFTENLYERERFEEVLRVAADMRTVADTAGGELAQGPSGPTERESQGPSGPTEREPQGPSGPTERESQAPADALVQEWLKDVGKGVAGYVTPKIAVGAVVGNSRNELLLVQRADSGVWLYPTGWADIGYSASEVAVKEVLEETGMQIEPVRLIAVLDGLRLGFTKIPLYSLVFHCRVVGGALSRHPLECRDVGWFPEDRLPFPLAAADQWSSHAFRAIRGEPTEVFFDRPRQPPWRVAGEGA